MQTYPLFAPMLVQIGLTIFVGFYLGARRVAAIKKQGVKTLRKDGWPKLTAQAGANFINQFEVPILFYALCLMLTIMGDVSQFAIVCAWLFVCFRILHAGVQLTSNIIFPYRFGLFLCSGLAGTALFFAALMRFLSL